MDPINPWLDASEVRQLAESLLPPKQAPKKPLIDAGFNEQFVGFTAEPAATPPAPAPAPAPASAPARVESSLAAPDAAIGTFTQQCQQFQQRMKLECRAEALFIMDREGKTVYGEDQLTHLHFIARSLTANAERRGLPKGHIHIKVGPAQTLEIIPVNLPDGGWIAGTVVPAPLDSGLIAKWKQEMAKLKPNPVRC